MKPCIKVRVINFIPFPQDNAPFYIICPIFIEFPAIFGPVFAKFDQWTLHRKRKDTCFLVFHGMV